MLPTERLLIRPWTHQDAPTALDILSRVEVVKWLGDGPPVLTKDLDEAREKIERWRGRDDPPLGHWACEVTDGGPLHGRVIGRWFFASTLSSRYTGSFETIMEADLTRIKEVTRPDSFVETLERIVANTLTNDFWAKTKRTTAGIIVRNVTAIDEFHWTMCIPLNVASASDNVHWSFTSPV